MEGEIRAIGVSNFFPERLVDLACCNEMGAALNQIETHSFYQRAVDQKAMANLDVQHGSWDSFAEGRDGFFRHETLPEIGKINGKSVAQVILWWMVQSNIVVLSKSATPFRIEENFDIFDFELSSHDMDTIAGLDTATSDFFDHRGPKIVKQFREWAGD